MVTAKEIQDCNSLDELMKLWYCFDNAPDFMKDGLMRNGVENMWPDFGCRVLFLLKEGNGNGLETEEQRKSLGSSYEEDTSTDNHHD